MDARSRFCFFTRSPCGMARPVELGGGAPRDGPGVHAREGWEEDERSSLVARVPLVFPVVRHGAVRGDASAPPRAGALARIDVLRHRCALPRVRGRRTRRGHAEPARGHALVHEPEELPGGVQRRRPAAALRPQRRDASATAGRAGVGFATSAGTRTRSAPRARRAPRRTRAWCRDQRERPTGPAHGGRTHGRATSAAPDARPSVPSARGVPRKGRLFSGPKVAPNVEARPTRARFSPRAPRAFLPPRDFRPCLAFRAPCAQRLAGGARARVGAQGGARPANRTSEAHENERGVNHE